ncbi:MAG: AAA family ATPase, partial [Planctomycetaceae bacterium]|nr:AAA family ATPase [Planctomycetaceae bacterium]
MGNSIHVIPFSGTPLEFDISGGVGDVAGKPTRKQSKSQSAKKSQPKKQSKKFPKEQQTEQSKNSSCGNLLLRVPDNGFLVGKENFVIERVVKMLLNGEMSREQFPILFYGQSGMGKTHLLQGIFSSRRERVLKRRKDVLISASDFARFFTEAIDLKATDDFRRRFRDVTMLLVDDIEQLANKSATVLEEFQHTLDVLVSGGVPVVLTSRILPKFPQPLFDRIISGTVLPIMLPELAVRRHFIELLLEAFRISVSDSVVLFAARELSLSIPAIYSVIARMVCEAMANDVKIDANYFKQFIKNRGESNRPSIEFIVKTVANYFSFRVSDIKGSSRNKTVAMARAFAVYLVRRESGLTLKQIASFFGNRDQSTI